MISNPVDYSFLKSIISAKGLSWQYIENDTEYSVFAADNNVIYATTLYKSGYEPIGCSDCATNTAEFEGYYKPTANAKLQTTVGATKPIIGQRAWTFSHNLCDKTTWYGDSVAVTNEAVGTGNGATVTFNFAHQYLIDLSHGKVTDEDFLVGTYGPVITVAGVTKTEQEFGETGGDYTIDYANGTITFATAPANGAAIVGNYHYSPANAGSTLYVVPTPGYRMTITVAEAQFSADFAMTDNVVSSIFTYNPGLGAPPAKFEYTPARSRYKRIVDFCNYTLGSFPIIPTIDAGGTRGLPQQIIQLRYDYQSALILDSSIGAELRVWNEHHRPLSGYTANISFYGYQEAL